MSIQKLQILGQSITLALDAGDVPEAERQRGDAWVTARIQVRYGRPGSPSSPNQELSVVLRDNAWEGNFPIDEPPAPGEEFLVTAVTATGDHPGRVRNVSASYLTSAYLLWFGAIAVAIALVGWLVAQELMPKSLTLLYPLVLVAVVRADSILRLLGTLAPWKDVQGFLQRWVVQRRGPAIAVLALLAGLVVLVFLGTAHVRNETGASVELEDWALTKALAPRKDAWVWPPAKVTAPGKVLDFGPKVIERTSGMTMIRCPAGHASRDAQGPMQGVKWIKSSLTSDERAACLSECGLGPEDCGTLEVSEHGVTYTVQLPWVPSAEAKGTLPNGPGELAKAIQSRLGSRLRSVAFPDPAHWVGATWTSEHEPVAGSVHRIHFTANLLPSDDLVGRTPEGGSWNVQVDGYEKTPMDRTNGANMARLGLIGPPKDLAKARAVFFDNATDKPQTVATSDLPDDVASVALTGLSQGVVRLVGPGWTMTCALGTDARLAKLRVHGGTSPTRLLGAAPGDPFVLEITAPQDVGVSVWSCVGPLESGKTLVSGKLRSAVGWHESTGGYCVDFTIATVPSVEFGSRPRPGVRCSR